MIVLGLDPGLAHLGWGVVSADGATCTWRAHGVLRTKRQRDMPVGRDLALRVGELASSVALLLDVYHPTQAAMEEFRFYGKGVTSSLQVANVVGMLREILRGRGIPSAEYSAQDIKQAVTGLRNAEKSVVGRAVKERLALALVPRPDHAADALGAAIAHAAQLHLARSLGGSR